MKNRHPAGVNYQNILNMKNSQSQLLKTGALLFIGIVVLVMIFQYIAGPAYKISNADMLGEASNEKRWVMPVDLQSLIENNRLQDYLLVDLRTIEEFNRGSLPGAVNIPLDKLLKRNSLKQMKSGKPVLLFSGKESQASVAGLLLAGKGFRNVMVMANDYTFTRENVLENYKPFNAFTHSEKAQYDYTRFFKAIPQHATQPSSSKPKIIETQVITSGGGC